MWAYKSATVHHVGHIWDRYFPHSTDFTRKEHFWTLRCSYTGCKLDFPAKKIVHVHTDYHILVQFSEIAHKQTLGNHGISKQNSTFAISGRCSEMDIGSLVSCIKLESWEVWFLRWQPYNDLSSFSRKITHYTAHWALKVVLVPSRRNCSAKFLSGCFTVRFAQACLLSVQCRHILKQSLGPRD